MRHGRGLNTNSELYMVISHPRAVGSPGMDDPTPLSELTITDVLSGQTIVHIEMTAEQLIRILTSTYTRLDAWMAPEPYRSHIGRKIEIETTPAPRDLPYSRQGTKTEPSELMTAWALGEFARAQALDHRWESWDLSHTQGGWALHLYRWVEVEKDWEADEA